MNPLPFLRAHGQTPGPTDRPRWAGALTGLVAQAGALAVFHVSGVLGSLIQAFGNVLWPALVLLSGLFAAAGVAYGRVFGRAANDRQGGWLFGISYGFLLWMITAVTIVELFDSPAVNQGDAGLGLFAGHLLFGLLLGLLFPWIHRMVAGRWRPGRVTLNHPTINR